MRAVLDLAQCSSSLSKLVILLLSVLPLSVSLPPAREMNPSTDRCSRPNACACGVDYSRTFANVAPGLQAASSCDNLPHAIQMGSRSVASGGFAPKGQSCRLQWFGAQEACSIVGSAGKLIFTGDSTIRQLLVGLTAILSGNLRAGGLRAGVSSDVSQRCDCERQWQCYSKPVGGRIARGWESKEPAQFTICPEWTRDHIVWTGGSGSNWRDIPTEWGAAVVIANGEALHVNLDIERVGENLAPILNSTANAVLLQTVHWPGPNKPKKHVARQGETAVRRYNAHLRSYIAKHKLAWLFDTYAFTFDEFSRDGVHYDDLNIGLAQLLLNELQWLQQRDVLPTNAEHQLEDPSSYVLGSPGALEPKIAVYVGPYSANQFNTTRTWRGGVLPQRDGGATGQPAAQ